MSSVAIAAVNRLDNWLMQVTPPANTEGFRRFCWEFWFFSLKQTRACLFVALFFACVLLVPRSGILAIPRYDVLLILALLIQFWMVWSKLETLDELKAICLFHLVGFALEVFKTSGSIQSWSYPDFAYSKVFGVPLFAGFMYAAVGSYIIQSWRLMQQRVAHHPPYWMAVLVALLIYANFFTHHYIGDYRWYIAAATLGLYARTVVYFTPLDRERSMPLLLGFVLVGFFIWLAENISTFMGLWSYPNQLGASSVVHLGKWSSWSLLVIMTFTIVAQLKYVKQRIDVPH
ncbi:MAG TPA: DUF817 domain-containing protein [Rheinheimera sp.]|uniref:DUF817 domain-containing protein n=1 Tax=Rheinheimera sp. TaxID=1869214 RepID=UPI002F944134